MKKRMVSGIKPTGKITLGNYLGAIKQFIKNQDEHELLVFIADLHALTLPIDPKDLRQNIIDLVCIYLACGLDPKKCKIFKQSDVMGHNDLSWVLTCNSVLGELTKMPQYKNYIAEHGDKGIPTGMLMYPSLMAADILLYDADFVPVGADQMSHIDLCRDMAEKFNKRFPGTFKLPSGVLSKTTSKIMSLSNPTRKMSKSESDKGTIYLLDPIEISKKKIMKALTDSENKFYYVLRTRDCIYFVYNEAVESWVPKEKKSFWLTWYSPMGLFEDIFLLPIIYVGFLPGFLSILMSEGFDKIWGIIFSGIPGYLVFYDIYFKKEHFNFIINHFLIIF